MLRREDRHHRAHEIGDTLRQHRQDHWHDEPRIGGACLVTLTLRHHAGMALVFLLVVLLHGWSRVTSGTAYVSEQQRSGVVGWMRPGDHLVAGAQFPSTSARVGVDRHSTLSGTCPRAGGTLVSAVAAGSGPQRHADDHGLGRVERVRVGDLSDPSTGPLGDDLSKVARETTSS